VHQRTSWIILAGVLASALVLALTGCGPADVSTLRRNYTAELNGWVAKEEPMAIVSGIDTVAGGEEGAEPAAEDEAAETPGEEMSESEEQTEGVFTSQTVILDIVVQHTGGGTLPGLTLDITQGGADGQEKANWKLWVDTSDLGGVKQITHTLEGVDLDEGDGFFVEVRQHVPEAERGEYKEFSSPS
jgi:hypothetical protein